MIVLGIGGGIDLIDENKYNAAHDSTAVLLDNGKLVFAIEEERLNRIKHTDKAPLRAIRECVQHYGIGIQQVDRIAVYGQEQALNQALQHTSLERTDIDGSQGIRSIIRNLLADEFGYQCDYERFLFVPHHMAHAMSTYCMSGFSDSLVLTMDGHGDGVSTVVSSGRNGTLEMLNTWFMADSLGFFYVEVIKFLGYEMFDEYKVMGLAPYGNPAKYRRLFKKFYRLLENGSYTIQFDRIDYLFEILQPRRKNEPFTQVHKDIAAALQEALETIVFHILDYYRTQTGHEHLCLAGGVALNCTLNGKILNSGAFKGMFVQPLSHDAGAALGAALYAVQKEDPQVPMPLLEHVYLGTDIGGNDTIERQIATWDALLAYEKVENIVETTAELLAQGKVIGWVQGRSEFGPRALGNRSILADPRPVENREIINAMVKMREAYRPFAPAVLEESVGDYYEVPANTTTTSFPYMIYVVSVKKEQQQLLGAVTHTDGTARIQTVSRATNEKFWQLIHNFGQKTGVPILLNTSFNNNAEPIVNSIQDAVVCFLTTKLHYLVIGDYLISRKEINASVLQQLVPSIPLYIVRNCSTRYRHGHIVTDYTVQCNYSPKYTASLSQEAFAVLGRVDGKQSLQELFQSVALAEEQRETVLAEMLDLWSRRLVVLKPGAAELL
ncbi:carbamoyltransferase family protein [Tengunoibacter tsumagoiensis]|uniref:Nodulation protein NolNO n=1 Tax=Tengunoibacter tsumagoiensis TaxID=2014871 RepID=A0A402A9T7_9CHLR|nr:carbamoyltransferase C-terminal domain-containing protein [Tengunoibacter tsumagoiensis]GCE15721.1 nodulation protein NolNO [Tengunoibacter tsumagoiensis]